MPQIAQQDHLYIQVADISDLSAAELALLKEKFQNGTIADVILTDGVVGAKIIAYDNYHCSYYSLPDGEITTAVFPE